MISDPVNKSVDEFLAEVEPSKRHFFRIFQICCQWRFYLEIAKTGLITPQIPSLLTEYGRIISLTMLGRGSLCGAWSESILVEISKSVAEMFYHGVVPFRIFEIPDQNKPIITQAGDFFQTTK